MPIRVTIELVPGGNEARKKMLGVMNIERTSEVHSQIDGEYGDYRVINMYASGAIVAGEAKRIARDSNIFRFLWNVLKGRNEQQ